MKTFQWYTGNGGFFLANSAMVYFLCITICLSLCEFLDVLREKNQCRLTLLSNVSCSARSTRAAPSIKVTRMAGLKYAFEHVLYSILHFISIFNVFFAVFELGIAILCVMDDFLSYWVFPSFSKNGYGALISLYTQKVPVTCSKL